MISNIKTFLKLFNDILTPLFEFFDNKIYWIIHTNAFGSSYLIQIEDSEIPHVKAQKAAETQHKSSITEYKMVIDVIFMLWV